MLKKRHGLIPATIAILIVFGALMGLLAANQTATKSAQARAEDVLFDSAQEQLRTLTASLSGQYQLLRSIAATPALSSAEASLSPGAALETFRPITNFTSLYLTDADGVIQTGVHVGSSIAEQACFQAALAGKPGLEVSRSRADDQLYFVLSVPFYREERMSGALCGVYLADDLIDLLPSDAYHGNSYSILINTAGNVIIQAEGERALSFSDNILADFQNPGFQFLNGGSYAQFAAELSARETGSIRYRQDGTQHIACYMPLESSALPENDWMLFNVVDQANLAAEISESRQSAVYSMVILVLCSAGALALFLLLERDYQNQMQRDARELMIVVRQSGKSVITYDPATRSICRWAAAEDRMEGKENPLYTLDDLLGGSWLIDCGENYRNFFRQIDKGISPISADFLIRDEQGRSRWHRHDATTIFNAAGKPLYAIISYYDVTDQREAAERYQRSLSYRELALKNAVDAHNLNITRNTASACAPEISASGESDGGDTVDSLYADMLERLPDNGTRKSFLSFFSRQSLTDAFAAGRQFVEYTHPLSMQGGNYKWVKTSAELVKNPDSGDLEAFFYVQDIDAEFTMSRLVRSVVGVDYDFIVSVSTRDSSYHTVTRKSSTFSIFQGDGVYSDALLEEFAPNLHPDDRERFLETMRLSAVKERLSDSDRQELQYRVVENGTVCHKKLTNVWLSELHQTIVFIRSDVTDVVTEQRRAWDTAERAKSTFLARMSHEMRTPLNAIIGFISLASGVDRPKQLMYRDNALVAARQLLAIINDVLDVSAIESGKMKIAREPFDFKELVQSLRDMFALQCAQKGLAFNVKFYGQMEESLIGDRLRLNQILINLLGNAVKFTDRGFVHLSIRCLSDDGEQSVLRFTVEDSGCGMGPEMIRRIGNSFEQESSTTATRYGGSGLGLSIVTSLIQLMGGALQVESQPEQGSAFTFDISFQKAAASEPAQPLPQLAGLRVLAVDDEPDSRDYIGSILTQVGVRHTCTDGGGSALNLLADAEMDGDIHNIVLINCMVPETTGVEVSRRIREKYGRDQLSIIIAAYEAQRAAELMAAADADLFVTRPLFPSSLTDTFLQLAGVPAPEKAPIPDRGSLAGHRILLAEDNAMNRMVAEGLLKKLDLSIDCAEDGRIALERFTASPPGYYDAVLMDIQMPNMGGYEATKAIRASAHPDAQTVSIIALSANAFQEDIARSLAMGMNDHIAKPIEPKILYSVLIKACTRHPRSGGD